MNYLSWLIYLANVTGSLSNFFVFVTVVLVIATVVLCVSLLVMLDETKQRLEGREIIRVSLEGKDLEDLRQIRRKLGKLTWCFGTFAFILGITSSLLPNRQTVLLIAASEMGEKILNHERVQTVIDPSLELLKTWMEQQTQEIKRQMAPTTTPPKSRT